MKSEEEEATRLERAKHFAKSLEDVGPRNVNDGIESHDGGPSAIFHVERQHVALLKFNGGIQFAGLLEHARRKIDAEDLRAAVVQVTRHVARAAAEFADAAGAFRTRRELIKKHAVERLVLEFAGNSGGVFFGDAVVTGLAVRKLLRIHGHLG